MISVITPTYNRAYILTQCYKSLCAQTDTDFEWIVVDDGSTDNTEGLVRGFEEEGRIAIRYLRQPNGGKHRAQNTGVTVASGELAVCLDSDDMLSPEAIETASCVWRKQADSESIGILALRGDMAEHRPICSSIPEGLARSSMSELRDRHGFKGDTVLFFKTDVLKENLFKEFENEKFLSENNLYCDLDLLGKMILLNRVLYYCEYRPDGLTAKYHKLLFDNPKGTADTYYKMALVGHPFYKALKYAIISRAYNNLLPKRSRLRFERRRHLMAMARIAAPAFAYKYLRKYKK